MKKLSHEQLIATAEAEDYEALQYQTIKKQPRVKIFEPLVLGFCVGVIWVISIRYLLGPF